MKLIDQKEVIFCPFENFPTKKTEKSKKQNLKISPILSGRYSWYINRDAIWDSAKNYHILSFQRSQLQPLNSLKPGDITCQKQPTSKWHTGSMHLLSCVQLVWFMKRKTGHSQVGLHLKAVCVKWGHRMHIHRRFRWLFCTDSRLWHLARCTFDKAYIPRSPLDTGFDWAQRYAPYSPWFRR